ncbi:MAG: hypothetical protein ACI4RI_05715, partial [Ruminococcus sp.]
MKRKILKSGKSLISLVLVAMLMFSLFSMNVTAAQVQQAESGASQTVEDTGASKDVDSAGANVDISSTGLNANFYFIGDATSWTTGTAINTRYNSSETVFYIDITMNNGQYFALANASTVSASDKTHQYGPSTDGTAIGKGSSNKMLGTYGSGATGKAWKYTGTSGKIRIFVDERDSNYDNQWYPYVWYEDISSTTTTTTSPTPATTTYTLQGRINFGSNDTWVTDTNSGLPLTLDSSGYYKYETGKSVSDLSGTIGSSNLPYYMYVAEKSDSTTTMYGSKAVSGNDFENNTASKKLTLDTIENTNTTSQLIRFSDTSATTATKVVIWYDPTNHDIWYTSDAPVTETTTSSTPVVSGYSVEINGTTYSLTHSSTNNKWQA